MDVTDGEAERRETNAHASNEQSENHAGSGCSDTVDLTEEQAQVSTISSDSDENNDNICHSDTPIENSSTSKGPTVADITKGTVKSRHLQPSGLSNPTKTHLPNLTTKVTDCADKDTRPTHAVKDVLPIDLTEEAEDVTFTTYATERRASDIVTTVLPTTSFDKEKEENVPERKVVFTKGMKCILCPQYAKSTYDTEVNFSSHWNTVHVFSDMVKSFCKICDRYIGKMFQRQHFITHHKQEKSYSGPDDERIVKYNTVYVPSISTDCFGTA